MTVMLLGRDRGHEFDLLRDAVRNRGESVVTVDVDEWPSDRPLTHDVAADRVRFGDRAFDIDEIDGVYVKANSLFVPAIEDGIDGCVSEDDNPFAALTQLREYRGLCKGLLASLEHHGVTVVPTHDALEWEERTTYACDVYGSLGIDVPETVATVSSETAKSFLERHGKVVYKAIGGVGGAHVMTTDEADRLEDLTTPVLFQAFVPGEDVRAYVTDETVVGAFEYTHDEASFTFKNATGGEIGADAVDLPDPVERDVRRAVEVAPMAHSAVDLRRRPDGTYALMETNPGGRFMLPDSAGITDVADGLAAYLVS